MVPSVAGEESDLSLSSPFSLICVSFQVHSLTQDFPSWLVPYPVLLKGPHSLSRVCRQLLVPCCRLTLTRFASVRVYALYLTGLSALFSVYLIPFSGSGLRSKVGLLVGQQTLGCMAGCRSADHGPRTTDCELLEGRLGSGLVTVTCSLAQHVGVARAHQVTSKRTRW